MLSSSVSSPVGDTSWRRRCTDTPSGSSRTSTGRLESTQPLDLGHVRERRQGVGGGHRLERIGEGGTEARARLEVVARPREEGKPSRAPAE